MKSHFTEELANLHITMHFALLLCDDCHTATPLQA